MSHDCCAALPHDIRGLSAVCDCVVVFPDHINLLFMGPVMNEEMPTAWKHTYRVDAIVQGLCLLSISVDLEGQK